MEVLPEIRLLSMGMGDLTFFFVVFYIDDLYM